MYLQTITALRRHEGPERAHRDAHQHDGDRPELGGCRVQAPPGIDGGAGGAPRGGGRRTAHEHRQRPADRADAEARTRARTGGGSRAVAAGRRRPAEGTGGRGSWHACPRGGSRARHRRRQRLQVRGLREQVPRLRGRYPRAPPAVRRHVRRRGRRTGCRLRPRRVPGPAARAGHPGARTRHQSRDGRGLPRRRSRCAGGRCPRLSRVPPGRVTRRADRRAGGRAFPAGVPDIVPRRRVPQAEARLEGRARDAESVVLVRLLRGVHPRHHARVAAAPGNAEVPRGGLGIPARRPALALAVPARCEAPAH